MKKLLAALLAAVSLSLSGCAFPSSLPYGQKSAVVTLTEHLQPVCAGVALSARVVLTATHCLSEDTRVDGQEVVLLASDKSDHSLLCVAQPQAAVALLDKREPAEGTSIHFWGHPAGLPLTLTPSQKGEGTPDRR